MHRLLPLFLCLVAASATAAEPELITAARNNDTHAVHRLLQDPSTDVAAIDDGGYTALHWAGIRANWDIVSELLDHGAPVTAIGGDGGSPLHWACHHDRPDLTARLLDAGANLRLANRWGRTPLHVAARRGCLGVVELLLERGADPEARTAEGWTPLHVARRSGQDAAAEALLAGGAAADAVDNAGRTPQQSSRPRPPRVDTGQDPDDFIGTYALTGGGHMLVWWADESLRLREFADDELVPVGEDRFVCRQEPWLVSFLRDDSGGVNGISVDFLRRTVSGQRLDEPYYVGSQACRECHSDGEHGAPYVTWLKGRHAGAYWRLATDWARFLAARRPHYRDISDPLEERRCLMCHHTAAQDPGAVLSTTFDPSEGIGCETCHGPGSRYLDPEVMGDRDRFLAAGGRIPDEATCRQCHRTPDFDMNAARAKLDHGGN